MAQDGKAWHRMARHGTGWQRHGTQVYANKGSALSTDGDKAGAVQQLEFDNFALERIPIVFLSEYTGLTRLTLRNNCISSVPSDIRLLPKLRELWLDNNQLSSLPRSLTELTDLTWLSLADNSMVSLPGLLGSCTALTDLDVQRNPIEFPPASLMNLPSSELLRFLANVDVAEMTETCVLDSWGLDRHAYRYSWKFINIIYRYCVDRYL